MSQPRKPPTAPPIVECGTCPCWVRVGPWSGECHARPRDWDGQQFARALTPPDDWCALHPQFKPRIEPTAR